MRHHAMIALLGSLGAAALGCQPHYDGLEIRYLNGTGDFSQDGIEIVEGQALAVAVTPISDSPFEDYENFDLVELESYEANILVVAPSTDVDKFVFIGAGVGRTAVKVSINGREVDTIDATVNAQTGAP